MPFEVSDIEIIVYIYHELTDMLKYRTCNDTIRIKPFRKLYDELDAYLKSINKIPLIDSKDDDFLIKDNCSRCSRFTYSIKRGNLCFCHDCDGIIKIETREQLFNRNL